MVDEIKPFWRSITDQWYVLMTGGGFGALLAVVSVLNLLGVQVGVQVSLWAAGMVFAITMAVAIFRAGKNEHQERRKLAERLKPKLEICGVAEIVDDHRRIDVLNLTDRRIYFRARLVRTEPPLKDYPLPVSLQPTHCQDNETLGEIGPRDHARVDVCTDLEGAAGIRLKLMGNPPYPYQWPRDKRIELLISVYPVDEDGQAKRRWFYLVPQPNGSMIFTPDGPGAKNEQSSVER
jgi:hypothetical protein